MPGMVSCSAWVRRGVAKSMPDRVALSKEDLEKVIKELKEDIDDVDEETGDSGRGDAAVGTTSRKRKNAKKSEDQPAPDEDAGEQGEAADPNAEDENDDIVAKYGLEDYDGEETEASAWDTVAGLTYYSNNDEDPYLTIKEEDNASDREDFEVKPTDNLLVVGRAVPECSVLEVYVYNASEGSLYCHHDMILPTFPLAVEWVNYDPGESSTGNLVAIGSMEPTIDLWDLDVVDSIEPTFVLGSKQSKRKKKKKGTVGGHTGAVLDLSWNQISKTALASASADASCGLWDLEKCKLVTLIAHKDKVQALRWHPCESEVLLTGSFDEIVRLYDCRSPQEGFKKWKLTGEVERVVWNSFQPYYFYASTESGFVFYVDTRTDAKPVFTLSAHSGAVTGLMQSTEASNCLLTASEDGFLKVWDTANNAPCCVFEKDMNMGELHTLSCCPESGFVYAIGSEKDLRVWDVREAAAVRERFCSGSRGSALAAAAALDVTALHIDSDEEDIKEFLGDLEAVSAVTVTKSAPAAAATQSEIAKRKKKKAKRKKVPLGDKA